MLIALNHHLQILRLRECKKINQAFTVYISLFRLLHSVLIQVIIGHLFHDRSFTKEKFRAHPVLYLGKVQYSTFIRRSIWYSHWIIVLNFSLRTTFQLYQLKRINVQGKKQQVEDLRQ